MQSSKRFVGTLVICVGAALAAAASPVVASAEVATTEKASMVATVRSYLCGWDKQGCIDVRNNMAEDGCTVGPIRFSLRTGYSFDFWCREIRRPSSSPPHSPAFAAACPSPAPWPWSSAVLLHDG